MSFRITLSAIAMLLTGSVVYAQEIDTTKTKELKEVTIFSDRPKKYNDTLTEVSTRIPTRLLDIPQSIQVIPQEIIKDQKLFTLQESIKNIAGVSTSSPFGVFTMRGFKASENNYSYNGIRGEIFNFNQQIPLFNVERIESIKGPASALFSNGSPGGIINIITKKPQIDNAYNFEFTYGSWNQLRFVADATGAITKNKKLLYRVIAGYENAESFRNFYKTNNGQLSAGLTYLFSSKTSLNIEYNYQFNNNNAAYDWGTYVLHDANGKPDYSKTDLSFMSTSPIDKGKNSSNALQLDFRHKVNEKVSFTVLGSFSQNKLDRKGHSGYGSTVSANNDSIVGRDYETHIYNNNFNTVTAFATLKANTWKIKHTFLIGGDYVNAQNPKNLYYYSSVAPSLSISNPDYSNDNPSTYTFDFIQDTKANSTIIGAYVQDQIEFTPKWKALLSLRYDSYKTINKPASALNYTQDIAENNATNLAPRFGLVYQPIKNLSFYGSYSQSFNPQFSLNKLEGGPFEPEKGIQYEVGTKGQFLRNKLNVSIALYSIDKTNILVNDPTDTNNIRLIPIKGINSKGVEFTVQGNITSDFSVIANLALNNAVVTKTSSIGKEGDRLPQAPNTISSLWLNYKFSKGIVKGLGIGVGMYNRSNTIGLYALQDYPIPGYTTIDAALNYRIKKVTLGVNVNNLTNAVYFVGGVGDAFMFSGAPRNFRASIAVAF